MFSENKINAQINKNIRTEKKGNNNGRNGNDNTNDMEFSCEKNHLINEFNSMNIKMQTNTTMIIENKNNNDNKHNENCKNKKEAPFWDEQCAMISQGYESKLCPTEMAAKIKEILNKMVEMAYIDWNEIEPFCVEGRIYTMCDNAEFRCEIYQLPNNNHYKSIFTLTRMFGDGWIFQEFRTTFLQQLFEKNYIVENCFSDNNNANKINLHVQLDHTFNNNDNLNNTMDRKSTLNDNDDADNNNEDDILSSDKAKQLVFDAIDCTQQRDVLRENLLSLRLAIDDEKKIKVIYQIDNIFILLLQPIIGENQLYDTWIIKTILEIVNKLVQYGSTTSTSLSQQQSLPVEFLCTILCSIKQQWANIVHHPLGLSWFYPSQQIVRICNFN